jgi:preprotein translocase subunit YajC
MPGPFNNKQKLVMAIIQLFWLQTGGGIIGLLPIPLMIAVFYFLIIRPQQKQRAELQVMIESLKSGDKVVTSGGIIGTIKQVNKGTFILQSADKAMLEVTRAAIAGRYDAGEEK